MCKVLSSFEKPVRFSSKDVYNKTLEVIESCNTMDQLNVAHEFMKLGAAGRMYKFEQLLYLTECFAEKVDELCHA